jgi:hypothetical protein
MSKKFFNEKTAQTIEIVQIITNKNDMEATEVLSLFNEILIGIKET